MNSIAFIFSSSPHGTTSGREGLDALLVTSTLTKNIGVFFIGDGIFQIIAGQKPHNILMRDYISTFKILPLYDIEVFWVCAASLKTRGLTKNTSMVLDAIIVNPTVLREKLASYNILLNF